MDWILDDIISPIFEAVTDFLPVLTAIPIVGEIIDACDAVIKGVEEVFNTVKTLFDDFTKSIIKPLREFLDDVRKGLLKIKKVLVTASNQLPCLINTMKTLGYLGEIAQPLASILKDTEPGKNLNALINKLTGIQKEIHGAIEPFAKILEAILKAAKSMGGNIKKAFETLGKDVGKAMNGLSDITDEILKPIKHAFSAVINAVKPLKWVLDKIQWLIDHVLMPVVNKLIEKTGLETLKKKFESEVLKAINITDTGDNVKDNTPKDDDMKDQESSMSSKSSDDLGNYLSGIANSLAEFKTNKKEGTRNMMISLVSDLMGKPIDPTKTLELPKWSDKHDVPDVEENSEDPTKTNGSLLGARDVSKVGGNSVESAFSSDKFLDVQHDLSLSAMQELYKINDKPVNQAPSVKSFAEQIVEDDLDPVRWSAVVALFGQINLSRKDLQSLHKKSQDMDGALQLLIKSLVFPTSFEEQMSDLSELFEDIDKILELIENIKVKDIAPKIEPFRGIIEQQGQYAKDALEASKKLPLNVEDLSLAIKGVQKNIPTQHITDTLTRIDGWHISLYHLAKMIDDGYEIVNSQNETHMKQLNAFTNELSDIASKLTDKLQTISGHINGIDNSIDLCNKNTKTYSDYLQPITENSPHISDKALPALTKVTHIFNIVESILNPLSAILNDMDCIESEDQTKKFSAGGVKAMKEAYFSKIDEFLDLVGKELKHIGDNVLPLGKLNKKIDEANTAISTTVLQQFKDLTKNLELSLQQLDKELVETKEYTYYDEKLEKNVVVQNDIMSGPFAKEIADLYSVLFPDKQTAI